VHRDESQGPCHPCGTAVTGRAVVRHRDEGVCPIHVSVMNHRAAVLASPDSRVQIGFIQDVTSRPEENDAWFKIARDQLLQRQLDFVRGLVEPYADGIALRAGPPFCSQASAPFILLVPRLGVVLCDIVERRAIAGLASNRCTSCGDRVMIPAEHRDKVGDEETADMNEPFSGKVSCGCGTLQLR
jgi:hypothetical protein